MTTEVIIPFVGTDRYRLRALAWVRDHLDLPVMIAEGSFPWVKANAVNPVIQSSHADIIVMHDADVYTEGLSEAVCAVAGGHPWAIPHRSVYRLSEAGTEAYMRDASSTFKHPFDRQPYEGIIGGGIIVARRDVLMDVPLDPRFTLWGQEDESHGAALETLYGRAWRGEAPLIHLWHPPAPRVTNRWGSEANRRLYQEHYHRAIGNPTDMRIIVEEAKAVSADM